MTAQENREKIAARRIEIAQMLRLKMRSHEIHKALRERGYDIPIQAVYDDISFMNRKTREWYYNQAQGDILTTHKLSVEVLEERQRKLMVLEADKNLEARDRIAASIAIAEIEVALHNWLPITQSLMMRLASEAKPAAQP